MATSGYSSKISAKKGGAGAIDGAISGLITALIINYLTHNGTIPIPEGVAIYVSALVGILVSALVIAIKRFVGNWLKNKGIEIPDMAAIEALTSEVKSDEPKKEG